MARIKSCFIATMDVAVPRMRIVRKGLYASDIMEILTIMEMIDIYVIKSTAGLRIKLNFFGFLENMGRGGYETENVIINYSYDGWGNKGYFINVHDGKTYKNLSVACSTTGCDCAGTPLAKDYLCTRHTVILDRADRNKDPWYYSEYTNVCPKHYLCKGRFKNLQAIFNI